MVWAPDIICLTVHWTSATWTAQMHRHEKTMMHATLQLAGVRQSALLKHPLWQVLQAPCHLGSVPWRAICEVRQPF